MRSGSGGSGGESRIPPVGAAGETLASGDKVYRVNRGKAVFLAVIGEKGLEEGVQIGGAHIDSPRIGPQASAPV